MRFCDVADFYTLAACNNDEQFLSTTAAELEEPTGSNCNLVQEPVDMESDPQNNGYNIFKWTDEQTKCMLDMYKTNMANIGPLKK